MTIVTKFFSFIVLMAISSLFINYSTGQPDSLAGAPGEGSCRSCHGGSPFGSNITLDGTPTSYTPGQVYSLTLTVTDVTKARAGFQIVATNGSDGTQVGTFSSLPSNTGLASSNRLIHLAAQEFSTADMASWTFNWTAPSAAAPANIVFYYVAVAGNVDGSSGGDIVHKGNTANIALGVELISFSTVVRKDNQVQLDWKTASETNNKGFVIERKTDNMPFYQAIATVKGHGSTAEAKSYSFVDESAEVGKINYYRLRQEDFDGKTTYSKVLSVALKTAFKVKVYPSVVKNGDVLTIETIGSSDKSVDVDIVNMAGQVVKIEKNAAYTEGVQFPVSNLVAGRYIVKVRNSEKQNYASFVVQ